MKRTVTLLLAVVALMLNGAVANARDEGTAKNDRKRKPGLERIGAFLNEPIRARKAGHGGAEGASGSGGGHRKRR